MITCGENIYDCINHKKNRYLLNSDYGIGYTVNTGHEFYFDLEDLPLIQDYCWIEHILKNGYHSLEAWDSSLHRAIKMHWIVAKKTYDHINHNPLDNRKCNLRPATPQENMMNRSIPKNNTSGYIGVRWMKDRNQWRAEIKLNNKRVCLGSFTDKECAIRCRLEAEKTYYGAFAPQRNLFIQYGIS